MQPVLVPGSNAQATEPSTGDSTAAPLVSPGAGASAGSGKKPKANGLRADERNAIGQSLGVAVWDGCGDQLAILFWPIVLRLVRVLGIVMIAIGTTVPSSSAQVPVQLPPRMPSGVNTRIHFDLSGFEDSGLLGPPDGLRAAAYEFCIPAHEELASEVKAIDPTVQIFAGSPGRIGCTDDQYLCIGSTHQPGFRSVLVNLAQLDYVTRIELSFAE
jgi:hypothetical protein